MDLENLKKIDKYFPKILYNLIFAYGFLFTDIFYSIYSTNAISARTNHFDNFLTIINSYCYLVISSFFFINSIVLTIYYFQRKGFTKSIKMKTCFSILLGLCLFSLNLMDFFNANNFKKNNSKIIEKVYIEVNDNENHEKIIEKMIKDKFFIR